MTIRLIVSSIFLAISLSSCGTTGSLYLTPEYKAKHATKQYPNAPSATLSPLQRGQ